MPYTPYLVYGTVNNSLGNIEESAELTFTTSLGTMSCKTNSDGIFLVDLADVGYSSGETVSVLTKCEFNNEYSEDTLVISGGMYNLNVSLSSRTKAQETTGYTVRSMLHSIGNSPVTRDNPLPIELIGQSDTIDLINNPASAWTITNADGQPDSETATLANGDIYKRTFTYSSVNGMRILTARSKWVKQ